MKTSSVVAVCSVATRVLVAVAKVIYQNGGLLYNCHLPAVYKSSVANCYSELWAWMKVFQTFIREGKSSEVSFWRLDGDRGFTFTDEGRKWITDRRLDMKGFSNAFRVVFREYGIDNVSLPLDEISEAEFLCAFCRTLSFSEHATYVGVVEKSGEIRKALPIGNRIGAGIKTIGKLGEENVRHAKGSLVLLLPKFSGGDNLFTVYLGDATCYSPVELESATPDHLLSLAFPFGYVPTEGEEEKTEPVTKVVGKPPEANKPDGFPEIPGFIPEGTLRTKLTELFTLANNPQGEHEALRLVPQADERVSTAQAEVDRVKAELAKAEEALVSAQQDLEVLKTDIRDAKNERVDANTKYLRLLETAQRAEYLRVQAEELQAQLTEELS